MEQGINQKYKRIYLTLIVLTLVLIVSLPMFIVVGPMEISSEFAVASLLDFSGISAALVPDAMHTVIQQIRLPRAILCILVGSALAISGAALQGMFRNPLADPGLIGITGGASLAAVTMIVFGAELFSGLAQLLSPYLSTEIPLIEFIKPYSIMAAAFLGGLFAMLLIAQVATSHFGTSIVTLLLAGLALNLITGAGVGILTYLADEHQTRLLMFWSMGSLGGASWHIITVASVLLIPTLFLLTLKSASLNALVLGESEARHLGIDVDKVKRQIILLTAFAVSIAVSITGPIGFVGFIVPHLVRLAIGPDHRYLLPGSALLGSLLLLYADMISRTLIPPAELPIGLITSVIGGPIFIALIMVRAKRFSI